MCKNRASTVETYRRIWHSFNSFLIKLDYMPKFWEDRTSLFCAFLIENGAQSATIKTYVSAIKFFLVNDGYEWNDSRILLSSLAKACRMVNDRVRVRLPIHYKLLEVILFEVDHMLDSQLYLKLLYKTIFCVMYYGLLRAGEVSKSPHVIRVHDVHIATNKQKMLLVLYTSKMHGLGNRPQKVSISAIQKGFAHHFCPFQLMHAFVNMRGCFNNEEEQFFVFQGGLPVQPQHLRTILKNVLGRLNIDARVFNLHSFRIGRASDMVKFGYTIEKIKLAGRWKSNAVFKYIHC